MKIILFAAYCSKGTTPKDEILVDALFSHIGMSESVPENLMLPIGTLSGSGPAYVCDIIFAIAIFLIALCA